MKQILSLLLLLATLIACEQKSNQNTAFEQQHLLLKDSLTQRIEAAFDSGAIMGLSVSVVNTEGVLYENAFGIRDLDRLKKYESTTTQNIASISKTLIGVALLKAQEQGKLQLDDPINQYLPFDVINPNYPDTPILIKHLAYHTSSIQDLDGVYGKSYVLGDSTHADHEVVYEWFSGPKSRISLMEFMQNSLSADGKWYVAATFANTKPGEIREYSNIASALCALIIGQATGQDYRDYTKTHIIQPLQMNASGWTSADIDTTQRSKLFYNKEKLIAAYSLLTYPDGGFITSNSDLGLFLMELMRGYKGQGTLLSKESYETLFNPQRFSNVSEGNSFGIFMEFTNEFIRIKGDLVGHNGSDPGVVTAMYFRPETATGKIVLINSEPDIDDNFWPEAVAIWKALMQYEEDYAQLQAGNE